VNDLMLRHDVVEAVTKKLFHVYAVRTIDEGIEILSGKPAGKRLANGRFQRGTIHGLVDVRLRELSRKQKKNGS
jgi:predicted ATP-dependent protease